MAVSCVQDPVRNAETPSQIRDREQTSMQKIVNLYKGRGAFDTTLEKGQTGGDIFWTMMKDVVPPRFTGGLPKESAPGALTFTMHALSPNKSRNLKIIEYIVYREKQCEAIDA